MLLTAEPQLALPAASRMEVDRSSAAWDIGRGPGNYLALVGMQAIASILSFAGLWVATRVLGPTGYGGVAAILAASQCVGQIAVHWSAVSLVRYGCEEFVATGRLANAFWARLLILLPNLILVIATAPGWLPPLAAALHLPARLYPLVVAHLLTTALWVHVQQALQAAKLPRVQGRLLAVERGQVLLALVVLTASGQASPSSVVLTYILPPLVVCFVGFWRLRALVYPGIRINSRYLKRMLTFSAPLIPFCLVGYLSTNSLDALFVAHFLSAADLGQYAVAYQFAGTLMQLPSLAGSLLLPFFITLQVNQQQDRIACFVREQLPLLTLAWSTGCVLAGVLFAQLIAALFGPRFHAVPGVLWPLMAAAALAGPALMGYSPVSNAKSATYVATISGAAAGCANLFLNWYCVPRWGIIGCAWATSGAYGVGMVSAACCIHRMLPGTRAWTLQATLPALVGAAYATWRGPHTGALAASLVASALLAVAHRRSVLDGTRTLKALLKRVCVHG